MNSASLEPTQASGSEEIDDESSLVDLGNLAVVDSNPLDTSQLGSSCSKYLLSRSERSMQMLAERLWKAPIEQTAETVLAELPKPSIAVPREKPVPKPAPPTKWEQYAKLKGIQKKKRSRMVFDEASKDWKPRWGAQRAGKPDSGDWLTELSDDEEPTKKKQKSLKALSTQHKSVLEQTKASTASAGKFFDPVESTKPKAKAHKKSKSKKRAGSVSAKSVKKGKVKGKGKGKGRGQAKKKGRK
ncbi:uncharacterized protein [Oscarella lobularis]|uniref:uncharacterized protein isoform X2 n=1 Tax=Oscarella lobularis TaxID=121494 RepID=UPI003313AC2E